MKPRIPSAPNPMIEATSASSVIRYGMCGTFGTSSARMPSLTYVSALSAQTTLNHNSSLLRGTREQQRGQDHREHDVDPPRGHRRADDQADRRTGEAAEHDHQ